MLFVFFGGKRFREKCLEVDNRDTVREGDSKAATSVLGAFRSAARCEWSR
jgi:hypothetical protein